MLQNTLKTCCPNYVYQSAMSIYVISAITHRFSCQNVIF